MRQAGLYQLQTVTINTVSQGGVALVSAVPAQCGSYHAPTVISVCGNTQPLAAIHLTSCPGWEPALGLSLVRQACLAACAAALLRCQSLFCSAHNGGHRLTDTCLPA